MNSDNRICGYDGFKLFIPGEDVIEYLIKNSEKFHLHGRYSVHDERKYELPLQGYYGDAGYKLRLQATMIRGLGAGVEVTGSFHKFYNDGNNDNVFYWTEFKSCLDLLHNLLPFEASRVYIVNLEIGLNLCIPKRWNVTAKQIIRNVVTYKGKYTNRMDIDHRDEGYFLQYAMTEYFLKMYDKSMQYQHEEGSILRFEIKVKKSSYLKDRGISLLSDLLDYNNQLILFEELIKLSEHVVIYQDELNDEILFPDLNEYCRQYNRPSAWEDLHNENVHRYKYVKKEFEKITSERCIINYKKGLQNLMTDIINTLSPNFLYNRKTGTELQTTSDEENAIKPV
jgi:hypothetical protein